jgi:hypothetical protein
MRRSDDLHSSIIPGSFSSTSQSVVRRAIIDNEVFESPFGLRQYAFYCEINE